MIPRPPCGTDGQWVWIVSGGGESTNPDDRLDVEMARQASWFGPEAARLVVLPGLGVRIYPRRGPGLRCGGERWGGRSAGTSPVLRAVSG